MSVETAVARRCAVGAELQPEGGAHFRVWAPKRHTVSVVFGEQAENTEDHDPASGTPLACEGESGYFSGLIEQAKAGDLYRYRMDEDAWAFPDPASRFQPHGCHGASQIIDPAAFAWTDAKWSGLPLDGAVVYELHIGTFTTEGTYAAAAEKLDELCELGINVVEIMPLNEFPGEFGWGYDGVDLFAPTRLYGQPDDLRRLIDRAHGLGMAVVLDVVYNHFGPRGNYLNQFSDEYISPKHKTEWGDALNFDAPDAGPVRDFFVSNAGYWIDEYHFDGLRLDATHAILDDTPDHIVGCVVRAVRRAANGRQTLVFVENEHQEVRNIKQAENGGYGADALWNDDFHHSARVAMTGHNEFYYGDYLGTPQELISAVRWGYLYQGQVSACQKKRRGTPAFGTRAKHFVTFLQNHDQVANSGRGQRTQMLTSPGRYRAMTALWLLAPGTPMFFQGQEFACTSPFMYFADHEVDVAKLVREGRMEAMRQFRSLKGPDSESVLSDPCSRQTFERSKIDWSEREWHTEALNLHRDLLKLRREDPIFRAQNCDAVHGAVLGNEVFLLRYVGHDGDHRLVLVNMGRDLRYTPASEPLLAPPFDSNWQILWSSEDPSYGGSGTGLLDTNDWYFPGHAAIVLSPKPRE